jgi:hypothetical protein
MKTSRVIFIFFLLAVVWLSLLSAYLPAIGGKGRFILTRYLPTPRPSEPCDVCEPNDSWNNACGPLAPGKSYQFFIHCPVKPDDDCDNDRFYIDLGTPGTFTVSLVHIPTGTDYSVHVYNKYQQPLLQCSSDNRGNANEYAICDLTQPGRYYIQVYPWEGCNNGAFYRLSVGYPTPPPTPVPTSTPTPQCNVHIDDFYGSSPYNDLGKPSGSEVDPPGCGTIKVTHTDLELQLEYDVTSPHCTARYTTALSLSAHPYELLTFEIKGSDRGELASTVVGLSDEAGHEMRIKMGDFLNQVITDTWQGVAVPLAAFATTVDMTHLDTLFFEFADTQGASQGTLYLDSLRLEMPFAPLTVDNFDDQTNPNALGGGLWLYGSSGVISKTTYITNGTYSNSTASCAISYTVPAGGWILWETDLLGVDVSDYALLSFHIKGANGSERFDLDLEDGSGQVYPLHVEDYTPIETDWALVRVPLQAFEGVDLTDLTKLKFISQWNAELMTGTIFLDDLRFITDTLLVDNFCDDDENHNSINGRPDTYTSPGSCSAIVTPTLSGGTLSLDYNVSDIRGCLAGYFSRTALDLNPYCALAAKVRGEHCGQIAAISVRTIVTGTEHKIDLSDYLLDGITDEWQEARIPLAALHVFTDWSQGHSYEITFEGSKDASEGTTRLEGTTWWDDVIFETSCPPLWVDNFNDEDNVNALGGSSMAFASEGAEITSITSITQAYGDAGAGLALRYTVPAPVGEEKYAGWETWLGNRNLPSYLNLSNYDLLIFNIKIKNVAGNEKPILCSLYDADKGEFVSVADYGSLSADWQKIVIPLEHFGDLDFTRIKALQFSIKPEHNDVQGMLFLDNIQFLRSANCSQIIQNQVCLPLIAKGYTPLTLDPVWDFESGTDDWIFQTYEDSQAVIAVEQSSFRSICGGASLAMIVDLTAGDDHRSQGEAYVDLNRYPPPGIKVPVDLECKPTSCWVYVPTCGLGHPTEPNLVELFVKDTNGRAEYGTPTRVVRNRWFKVSLRPSTLEPYQGYMEPGFDPHAVTQFGIRFRAGGEDVTYRGKVFVDACGWQRTKNPYEENDHWQDAYGPLDSGHTYEAYPDDTEDYYYFELSAPATVSASVEDFAPISSNGDLLLYGPASGDGRGVLQGQFGKPGHSSMSIGPCPLGPGKYYIRVYTVSGHYSTTELYSLTVTY